MAALTLRPPHSLDLTQLYTHVSENLPPYARPRFLRLQVTGHSQPQPLTPRVLTLHIHRMYQLWESDGSQTAMNPNVTHSMKRKSMETHSSPPFFPYTCLLAWLFLLPFTSSPKPGPHTPFPQTCSLTKFRQLP